MHFHFGRRHGTTRGGPLQIIFLVGAMLASGGGGFAWFSTREPPPEPPPAFRAAAALIPQGPVMGLLQKVGGPTCKMSDGAGERWVYAKTAAPTEAPAAVACTPAQGDLVVHVEGDRITSFVPEHGLSDSVETTDEMQQFRSRYGPFD